MSLEKIKYGSLFQDSHNKNNFLHYDDKDIVSTSFTYPHSDEYEYESYIEYIDFDAERKLDIDSGNGFEVAPSGRNIKKDLKAEDGLFSRRFGQTLADVNPFIDRYRCHCTDDGGLRGRINAGLRCPRCGHLCEYVDDNFSYFGWMVLKDPFVIIHPAFYKKIDTFLGRGITIQGVKRTKLENILDISDIVTPLSSKAIETKMKDEPYFGIGMVEFVKKFDEIMDFYLRKRPTKKENYDDIYEHRNIVFTHSIPVFTTLLRPFDIKDGNMTYEPTNAMYTMMNKLVTTINKNQTKIQREPKIKNQQLYNLQKKFMELYTELETILSGKKGDFRCLLGGRYNFSSRNVIVQNPDLRIDEVTLPVIGLSIMLEQRIKNILCRLYNMSPNEAHQLWYKSTIEPVDRISSIIQSIIDNEKAKGLPGLIVLINRNPKLWGIRGKLLNENYVNCWK